MKSFTCPNCGSNLMIDETDRSFAFCQYCGTKIDLAERYESTKRIVDEAKIQETRLKYQSLTFEQEEQRKNAAFKRKLIVLRLIISAVMIVSGILVYLLFPDKYSDDYEILLMLLIGGGGILGVTSLISSVGSSNAQ